MPITTRAAAEAAAEAEAAVAAASDAAVAATTEAAVAAAGPAAAGAAAASVSATPTETSSAAVKKAGAEALNTAAAVSQKPQLAAASSQKKCKSKSSKSARALRIARAKEEMLRIQLELAAARIAVLEAESSEDEDEEQSEYASDSWKVEEWLDQTGVPPQLQAPPPAPCAPAGVAPVAAAPVIDAAAAAPVVVAAATAAAPAHAAPVAAAAPVVAAATAAAPAHAAPVAAAAPDAAATAAAPAHAAPAHAAPVAAAAAAPVVAAATAAAPAHAAPVAAAAPDAAATAAAPAHAAPAAAAYPTDAVLPLHSSYPQAGTYYEALQSRNQPQDVPAAASQPQQINISELASAIALAAKAGQRATPRYHTELPFFAGSHHEWLSFRAAYYETAEDFTETENVARLRRSLRGRAKEAVENLLILNARATDIMRALESRFGRPDSIAMSELDRLRALPRLTDNPRDVCVFASRVLNVVASLRALDRIHYLYSPEATKITIEKLTPALRYRWFDYAATQTTEEPDLLKLTRFLQREANLCGPYAQPETEPTEHSQNRMQRAYTTAATVIEKIVKCRHCATEGHLINKCPKFEETDVNSRWEIAKSQRLCFRCLRYKNKTHSCKRIRCGEDGCNYFHHRLLHFRRSTETGPETKNSLTVSSVWSPRKTHGYLKILPVKIVGPAGEVHTHALLDDGSTVTLIDAAIAKQAGLTGPIEPLNIAAIADTKINACHSRRVKVTLQRERAQYTIQARTIDNIRLSAQTVKNEDLRSCAHLRDIAQHLQYEAARPKIVIGQDNCHLLIASEVRQGQAYEPVASHTPLGWVLHGAHTRTVNTRQHRVNRLTTLEDDLCEPLIEPTRPHSNLERRATSTLAKCTKQTEASRSCRRYAARRHASIEDHSTVHDRRWASKMNVSSTATRDVHRLKGRPHSVVQTTATDQWPRRRVPPRHRSRRRRRRRREQLMIESTGSDERAGHPTPRACGARRPSPRSAMTTTASMHGGSSSPPVSLALRASGESSPKRAATLPDALLRGLKMSDPPVYIPNLQEETILAEEHSKVFSQLNFVLMLAELLSDLAVSCGAPIAALMDNSHERSNDSVRLGLLVQAMQALAAGLRLAAARYRDRALQPTPQVRSVVSLMNGKYKWILNESRRLHEAGVAPAVCDKILYEHAIELCQMAALEELFGDMKECERRYMSAQVLLHSLVQRHPLHPHHRTTLSKYRDAVQRRLNCLKGPRKLMDVRLEAGVS
ncbi:unnamed protein product [Plutella xylostella]|uniref:(diamondback moth) hypothetical protein n=1 Tax=Plutella xylostella TaxID=51655 RepID=A0A8S4DS12_PLUXY|nr:unnamed protein product [Plutella xylostella]